MAHFSIITVTYNAERDIEKTIESVAQQTYDDFEYIIKDGCSTDDTITLASKYKNIFQKKGIRFEIIREKDLGIYNAMNNSVAYAKGKYILFLNAGDFFANRDVLLNVDKQSKSFNYSIIYGDTILSRNGLYKYEKAKTIDNVSDGIPFGHQSVFTLRDLLLKKKYDERYRICADYDFYAEQIVRKVDFLKLEIPISVYILGGMSSLGGLRGFYEEKYAISYKYGLISEAEYKKLLSEAMRYSRKLRFENIIKKIVPKTLIHYHQKNVLRKAGWTDDYQSVKDTKE